MKNLLKTLFIALLLLGNIKLSAQSLFLDNTFKSVLLNTDVHYSVFVPGNYDRHKTYPVIFYLHGFGGDHHEAEGFTKAVDSLITRQQFPETVVIAPDAGTSWYIDDYAGKNKYASMFISELLPEVQKRFSISTQPKQRVVMGMSMGGFGALRFSMLHPEQFGVCVSLMGAIMTKEQARDDQYYDIYHHNLYGDNLKGEQRINPWFINNNPLYIIESRKVAEMSGTRWYIQCCDQDFHSLPNSALHIAMRVRNIPHEFRTSSGDHTGECYNAALPEAISFIRQSLKEVH